MSRAGYYLYHICRLVLGGLFLYAGAVKANNVVVFARDVANYQLLPYAWNYLVAATLPYVEAVAALLLIFNRKVRPSALLLALLTFAFMVALTTVVARGMDIDCGCFNPGQGHTSASMALLRDVGILLLALLTLRLRSRMLS
ncbi:MauE/DoxX family redox-associated membrane protein [Trichloromonas sp.]|uniref:MauE/DoxX family redox-associated membrane protein n=1 Tax=Trichloromonas sp. TaxID=3069249 RepID=UPI003D8164F5